MNDTGYFDALETDDTDRCEMWMSQVKTLAETKDQKARAAFLYRGWEQVKGTMTDRVELLRYAKEGLPPGARLQRVFLNSFTDKRANGNRSIATCGRRL